MTKEKKELAEKIIRASYEFQNEHVQFKVHVLVEEYSIEVISTKGDTLNHLDLIATFNAMERIFHTYLQCKDNVLTFNIF